MRVLCIIEWIHLLPENINTHKHSIIYRLYTNVKRNVLYIVQYRDEKTWCLHDVHIIIYRV